MHHLTKIKQKIHIYLLHNIKIGDEAFSYPHRGH